MKTLLAIVIMALGLSLFAVVAQLPEVEAQLPEVEAQLPEVEEEEKVCQGFWVKVHGVYSFFTEDEVIEIQ